MRRGGSCALLALAALGCEEAAPLPRGELLLEVDTDVAVPELASRLRVDLYTPDGRWIDSRDVFLGNADAWPASFSLLHPDDAGGAALALVRLRSYPEGATRDYLGERNTQPAPFVPVVPATSKEALCADPPLLALGGSVTVRRGREGVLPESGAFTGSEECAAHAGEYVNHLGSAAVRVDIAHSGHYHFAVIGVSPSAPSTPEWLTPQITFELRTDCADNHAGLACTYGMIALPNGDAQPFFPSLELDLDPGTYFLVTGGVVTYNGAVDMTVAAWSDDVPLLSQVPTTGTSEAAPVGPLLEDDPAATPRTEPDPLRTIDRLVRVSIAPHERRWASVTLRGDCLATGAVLGDAPGVVAPDLARGCVDDAAVAVAPAAPELVSSITPFRAPRPSRAGSFASDEPCAEGDSDDRFVCVPSGALILGAGTAFDEGGLNSPPRSAALHRFFIDRTELTVADYREALASGLSLPADDAPFANDSRPSSPEQVKDEFQLCTFSEADLGREALPLNCIPWFGARAFCQFRGGDLPSSAQWEYAAVRAGREHKAPYPWGDTAPSCGCDGADASCRSEVFARDPRDRDDCIALGFGPAAAASVGGPQGDTSALGIVGMAGNVREWALDSALPNDHPCRSGVWDPVCWEPEATARVERGGSFIMWPIAATSTFFLQPAQPLYDSGVRCVYAAKP